MEIKEFGPVVLKTDGPVANILFNRPHKRNAMSPDIHDNMHLALDAIDASSELKIAVLEGAGGTFSAGMDLEKCFLEPHSDPDAYHRATDSASRWFVRWKNLSIPTLAKIRGWCFGGAMLVVGITDMAVAAEESVFGLSEVNFGIPPGGGTMWAVANNMSRKDALYYSYTAETFSGSDAARIGFVNRAVPDAELDLTVDDLVATVCAKGRHVLQYVKRFHHHASQLRFDESQSVELALHHELIYYSKNKWITDALSQFKRREFKPGLQSYEIDE